MTFCSLTQCLNNLISNAFKFTQEGGIHINCWEEPLRRLGNKISRYHFEGGRRENNDHFFFNLFLVEDTGIGIDPLDQNRLFRAFQQISNSSRLLSRKHSGTGLGLYITRSLVETMGGEIRVVSEKKKGTKFRFWIDLQRCDIEGMNRSPTEQGKLFDKLLSPLLQGLIPICL